VLGLTSIGLVCILALVVGALLLGVLWNWPSEKLRNGPRATLGAMRKSKPPCRLANSNPDQVASVLVLPRIDWCTEKLPHS